MEAIDFKIIAIRPTIGCVDKFRKSLEPGELYYLYKNYRIKNDQVEVLEELPDLYSFNDTKINISAIVGKNGTGKSSLVELIYVAFYNIAVVTGLLLKKNPDGEKIEVELGIKVEIYYKYGTTFFKIRVDREKSFIKELTVRSEEIELDETSIKDYLHFYSIVINYSHYSLNSRYLGPWVKNIFHKNDGYQTPIVLNPFRDEGKIDINNEEYLTRSRLISNLLLEPDKARVYKMDIRTLIPGKTATDIMFSLDTEKISAIKGDKSLKTAIGKNKRKIINTLYQHLLNERYLTFRRRSGNKTFPYVNDYIIAKLYNIIRRYRPYNRKPYRFIDEGKFDQDAFHRLINYILKDDRSHITYKIKQALNFIKNHDYYEDKINEWLSLDQYSQFIYSKRPSRKDIIHLIPPSFFKFDLRFDNKETFEGLSSGEKQKVFSTTTYIYHIQNLDSVNKEVYNTYSSLNIVFDEIELYYHPEWQRRFIADFIENIRKLHLESIKSFNCIMITHSPYILSDIPEKNALFLRTKSDEEFAIGNYEKRTFGANLHDLLKSGFFLNEGYMGEFAKQKIDSAIEFLNKRGQSATWNKESINRFIDLISEPLIRKGMRERYYKLYLTEDNEIDAQIRLLQRIKLWNQENESN